MSLLSEYRQQLELEAREIEKKMREKRIFIRISATEFKDIFLIQANLVIRERNSLKEFVIDQDNKLVINQLYNYFTGNKLFIGNFYKGILLAGTFGTGKTVILTTFCRMVNNLTNKRIRVFHAKELPEIIAKEGIESLLKIPIFIDDLGKEQKSVKNFGTEVQPVVDLLARRYDIGSWTLATSNYSMNSFKEFYGITISDRFAEIFNIIELNGKNRRQ